MTSFLPFPLQMILLGVIGVALLAGVGALVLRLLQGDYYYRQRIEQISAGIASDNPAQESHYCRNVYADSPLYNDCWIGERKAHDQFARAWEHGRNLSTLRDQMIRCFQEGQDVSGRSWQIAARCAELDRDIPQPSGN